MLGAGWTSAAVRLVAHGGSALAAPSCDGEAPLPDACDEGGRDIACAGRTLAVHPPREAADSLRRWAPPAAASWMRAGRRFPPLGARWRRLPAERCGALVAHDARALLCRRAKFVAAAAGRPPLRRRSDDVVTAGLSSSRVWFGPVPGSP
ncbi:eukaryotic translation initiation factor 3 subunit A-like [Dorcoceras hygrometricum]|uniref:Eukaryotic translation initiation factor 3 subunit A-like n=1 Tax=Dorcoceras hygrometricum TaxID=472368 RepID=A0A2Z7A388_9LAMI|nr:eukaryotic translation initiation factor 3 subunit A-like [Dorcoceras hygrometricum]